MTDSLSLSLSLPVVERRRNLNYLCPFFWRKPSSIIDERERAVSSARIKRADVCVPAIIKNNVDVFVPCKICPRPRFLRYAGRIARFWSSPSLLSRLSRPRATRQRRANYFRLLIDNSLLSPCHLSVPFSLSFLSLRSLSHVQTHTCVQRTIIAPIVLRHASKRERVSGRSLRAKLKIPNSRNRIGIFSSTEKKMVNVIKNIIILGRIFLLF